MMPLYLSQARLDRSKPAYALARVLDPFDENRAIDTHHQLVWTLFSDDGDRERDFLWRVDDSQFLILSERVPEDRHALFELRTKRFEPHLSEADRLMFRIRANAVVTRSAGGGHGKRGRRHDVVMDRMRRAQGEPGNEEQRHELRERFTREAAWDWLASQGNRNGFELESLDSSLYRTVDLPRRGHRSARLGLLDIDGVIRVREASALLSGIGRGFGKAKAFGCGLMLLRRA